VVGTGFCSPPRLAPMPTIRPWEDICIQRLELSEQRALDTANAVMRALGGEPLRYFHDLFDVEENILATLPELDHYGPRAGVPYWGPIFEANDGDEPQWPAGDGGKVFVYLRPSSPHFEDLIGILRNQKQFLSLWFAPGVSKESLRAKESESLAFVTKPLKISSVVDHADLAILNAGHGTCAAMMLAGVPMLLSPKNSEQRMLARVIETRGIAAEFRPGKTDELETWVWRLDETRKSRAKRVGMRYENLRQVEVVATIIDEAVCNFCDGRVARIACDSPRRLSAPIRTSHQ
jgi:UDP:flavonoid glycosyltransferase YjiC (YdhE family)